jgi:ATP-binding cassette subfamily B protein
MARQILALAMRADRRAACFSMVFVLLQAGAVAGTGMSQRWLVDATGDDALGRVLVAVALGVVSYVLIASIDRIQGNLSNDLSDRVELTLSQEILGRSATIATIEHLEHPDYLNRLFLLRRGGRSLAAFCWAMAQTASSAISLVLSIWLLGSVHPALILLALFAVPWLVLGHRAQSLLQRTKNKSAEAVRHEAHLHELCVQPDPAKEVRIAGNGAELSRRADELWRAVSRQEATARLRGLAMQSVGWLCFTAALAAALAIVAHLVRADRASVGDLMLVISLGGNLRQQISMTLQGLGRVGEAGRISDHYVWLREYASRQPMGTEAAPDRLATGIRLDNVTFCYPGTGTPVLRDLDLHLPAGSVVGLVGVNGAGKTSLVKLLTGMYRPTAGSVLVDGTSLDTIAPERWAGKCSGVFQDFAKTQLSVAESVGIGDLPRLDDSAAVADAIDRAGAGGLVASLPEGAQTQLGRLFGGTELSQGQWQRLAMARSLMRDQPLLLILDEPTAALDPQAEHEIFESFARQADAATRRRGAITLLVSHRFATVGMADHIVVLSEGRIVEQGSPGELMRADGPYAELYRTQAGGYAGAPTGEARSE